MFKLFSILMIELILLYIMAKYIIDTCIFIIVCMCVFVTILFNPCLNVENTSHYL